MEGERGIEGKKGRRRGKILKVSRSSVASYGKIRNTQGARIWETPRVPEDGRHQIDVRRWTVQLTRKQR